MKETDIQKAILEYLGYRKIFAWRNNTGAMKTETGHFYRFGLKGSGDILGVLTIGQLGVILCVEVKSEKGKQSAEQKEFQKQIEERGGLYILAKKIEDVEYGIQKFKEMHNV